MPFRRAVCRPSLRSLAALEKKGTGCLHPVTADLHRLPLALRTGVPAPQTLPIRDGTPPPSLRSFAGECGRARALLGSRPW